MNCNIQYMQLSAFTPYSPPSYLSFVLLTLFPPSLFSSSYLTYYSVTALLLIAVTLIPILIIVIITITSPYHQHNPIINIQIGGGGYTLRNVPRCWAYETSVLLDTPIKVTDSLPCQ